VWAVYRGDRCQPGGRKGETITTGDEEGSFPLSLVWVHSLLPGHACPVGPDLLKARDDFAMIWGDD